MCTCIKFKNNDCYVGRNLDLEYRFNEKVVVTPRNYEFKLKSEKSFKTKYAIIGMATVVDNYPLYAEGCNEKGLAIAGLYFPNNAYYENEKEGKINIAPFELIPWLLGNYSSVEEARNDILKLNIINTSFNSNLPLAPLHWMICDRNDCIVIEQTKDGFKLYQNDIGVMTNNPPFDYHLTNINNYLNLSPKTTPNFFSDKINLKAYSNGMGAIGLPGDASSASRFVRAAFNLLNSKCNIDEESSVSQVFHILDSVSMIRGTVITNENNYDITTYSCCINLSKSIYYYKTYNNNQICAVKLNNSNMNLSKLSEYPLVEEEQIKYIN